MQLIKALNLKRLIYPVKKYPSTCIAFTLIVALITLYAFYYGISDDRGFNLKKYLVNSYIVGDFDSYERSINKVLSDFYNSFVSDDPKNLGLIQGPLMPILILISRFISDNFVPYFIFSIYLSYWFIAMSLDIANIVLPSFDSQFSNKIFSLKFPRNLSLNLSYLEIFGIVLNPIILYYVIFPASDLPFACLVLAIICFFCREKYSYCYAFYILSIVFRPTGLFLFPAMIMIFYFDFKKRKKIRFFFKVLIVSLTLFFYSYYLGASVVNFKDTLQYGAYGNGLSIWGLPVPGWLINKNGNLNLQINKILSIILTPFVQLISVFGVRPSYTTIFDGNDSSSLEIISIKPYVYAYVRILWGAIINIPGFLFLLINFINFRTKILFLLLIIIFCFAIGLSSSIPLERYLFFAYPLLSLSAVSTYLKLADSNSQ